MHERAFFEFEALTDSIPYAAQLLDVSIDANQFITSIGTDRADQLNDYLVELLNLPEMQDFVTSTKDALAPAKAAGFGARIRMVRRNNETLKITFYRVKDSWESTALSLTGLALALLLHSPTIPLPAFGVVRNAWKNLITLKRPADDLAINSYEGLLKAQALNPTNATPVHPSTDEIHNKTDHEEVSHTIRGLARLNDLRLVKVIAWGAQQNDYSNTNNRWYQVF